MSLVTDPEAPMLFVFDPASAEALLAAGWVVLDADPTGGWLLRRPLA